MLCKYSYYGYDNKDHGEFQCDVEDFRKMFRRRHSEFLFRSCIVELDNGEVWIWSHTCEHRRLGIKGWERVRKGMGKFSFFK